MARQRRHSDPGWYAAPFRGVDYPSSVMSQMPVAPILAESDRAATNIASVPSLESAPVKAAVSVKACWDALRALQRRVTELETTDAMDLEATRAKIKALELVVALKESHHHIKDRIAPGEGAHG